MLTVVNISVLQELSCLKDELLARSLCVLAVNNTTFFFLVASLLQIHATYLSPPS